MQTNAKGEEILEAGNKNSEFYSFGEGPMLLKKYAKI